MSRPFGNILIDQLSPIVGQEHARLVSGVAEKLAMTVADDFSFLEDHVMLPAMASLLGYMMRKQTECAAERAAIVASGADVPPSLYQGNDVIRAIVEATVAADPRPNHHPIADYYIRQQMMEQAMSRFIDEGGVDSGEKH